MLEIIRDDKGNIKAVCDYLIINKQNRIDKEGSNFIIEEVEINPEYRNNGILRKFIKIMLIKYPKIEIFYFVRGYKYPGRAMRIYTRKQFETLIKED